VELVVRPGEMLSLRTVARDLYGTLERLNSSAAARYLLLDQRKEIRGVLLSADEYAALLKESGRLRPAA
jgi:hypothetical protein